MPTLQLAGEELRIVALAIAYHLGRPGSETDPATFQRHDLGLGPVAEALRPHLHQPRASLELTSYRTHRLDEALLGLTNELKTYELAHRDSVVPGFATAIAELFPALAAGRPPAGEGDEGDEGGEETALDLAERVVMLRRRIAPSIAQAEAAIEAEREAAAASPRRPWWRFWRR